MSCFLPVLCALALAADTTPPAPAAAPVGSALQAVEGSFGGLQLFVAPESSSADHADANAYLVADTESGEALVVDAGQKSAPLLLARAAELGVKVSIAVCTHFHADHTGGSALIAEKTSAKIAAPGREAALITGEGATSEVKKALLVRPAPRIDMKLKPGDEVKIGRFAFKVLELPGHSPGGIALHQKEQGLLLAGDSLQKGSIARTGLVQGAKTPEPLVAAIKSKLLTLPDETVVLPGHGSGTTIGAEKAANPWFKPPAKAEKPAGAEKKAKKGGK